MKKYILILLFFIFLFPLNTFAIEQNDKYFNLIFPDTFYDDLTDYKFGSNTDILDIVDSISSLDNNYRNVSIIVYYNATGFYRLNIILHPKDSVNSFSLYGTPSNSNLTINQYLYFSKSSQRWQISPYTGTTSFLDSNAYSQIKYCIETSSSCPTSKPSETDYSGSISFSSGTTSASTNFPTINNFDSDLDYDVTYHNLLYYTNSKYILVNNTTDTNIIRPVKYNDMSINEYDNFPSYLEYINLPDDPDNPDNPIDTNVGKWKNYVIWFVDNNSEYGVLVNIYILFFISIIGISFICFIKLINKSRW